MERLTDKELNYILLYQRSCDDNRERGRARWYEIAERLRHIENLEEEIGFPLEVIGKLRKANHIYRDDGLVFGFIGINFNDEDKLILYNDDEYNIFTSDLKLADYKKKFWLREDKSE